MATTSDPPEGADEGSSLDMALAPAEQACKECRRRKARCNRALPTCELCVRYGRHCLYEKHSRTPLTRKHLTEVEEKLERAESLIKRLRREKTKFTTLQSEKSAGPSELTKHLVLSKVLPISDETFDFCEVDQSPSDTRQDFSASGGSPDVMASHISQASNEPLKNKNNLPSSVPALLKDSTRSFPDTPSSRGPHSARKASPKASTSLPETPPKDGFEWDEQDIPQQGAHSTRTESQLDENEMVADGMASLSVSENETGYLGVASGAAMLRIMEPNTKRRSSLARPRPRVQSSASFEIRLAMEPDPNRHIADAMVDAYFREYHLSYPIIHEPTFRAQYSEVIPQPHGRCWHVLAYIVAAIGVYTSSKMLNDLDLELFARAKSILSFEFLEKGNITLVQALTLISNYQQKRDKPNSGYNYLGLAVRMATGLGLHKEFSGWNISPLSMEIRRRVWWSLCVFDEGATVTFSRPTVWPYEGAEVAFPLNVTDRDLTANSSIYPPEREHITPYTAVGIQAKFHVATHRIYSRVISRPFPTAEELSRLDSQFLQPWLTSLPLYFSQGSMVEPRFSHAHAVMQWRYHNFRIIMYRPFVIRKALNCRRGRYGNPSPADLPAYKQCLADADATIKSISTFTAKHEQNRLNAWYALYFLFQAALIPCICLRNSPYAPEASIWCDQICTVLRTFRVLAPSNAACPSCYQIIMNLCGRYLKDPSLPSTLSPNGEPSFSDEGAKQQQFNNSMLHPPRYDETATPIGIVPDPRNLGQTPDNMGEQPQQSGPIDESPQTQINHVYPLMWPNVNALEAADEVMGNDAWLSFLGSEIDGAEGYS